MNKIYFNSSENQVENNYARTQKKYLSLVLTFMFICVVTCGCGVLNDFANKQGFNLNQSKVSETIDDVSKKSLPETESIDVQIPKKDIDEMQNPYSGHKMVSYDVNFVSRNDPFMPVGEMKAFEQARIDAIAEANAHNAKIKEIEKLKNVVIQQPEDINPYSFKLPVPPTELAPVDSLASRITRTKVVGIMYNNINPSAIINVEDKDYLVRQGDKIIGEEYTVLQINKSWITVGLGSNVYSASIGEMFSKDELDKSKNDLYNLKNRFGGRKS